MKVKMLNGEFEVCLECGKVMAKRWNLSGFDWICLFGCGYIKKGGEIE